MNILKRVNRELKAELYADTIFNFGFMYVKIL